LLDESSGGGSRKEMKSGTVAAIKKQLGLT
jgi:hypothetical protein